MLRPRAILLACGPRAGPARDGGARRRRGRTLRANPTPPSISRTSKSRSRKAAARSKELTGKAEKIAKESDTLQQAADRRPRPRFRTSKSASPRWRTRSSRSRTRRGRQEEGSGRPPRRAVEAPRRVAALQRAAHGHPDRPPRHRDRHRADRDCCSTGSSRPLAGRAREIGRKVAAIRALRADIEMERLSLADQSETLEAEARRDRRPAGPEVGRSASARLPRPRRPTSAWPSSPPRRPIFAP